MTGAGGAKTFLGCVWIILNCLKYSGTRWVIGRSKLKALKETTLNTFFEVAKLMGMEAGTHYVYNAQSSTIQIGESEVILKDLFHYPSDPNYDSLGSLEITGAFIDECNQLNVKAKEILKSRIRYKLEEFGLIPKLLLTCNPAKNWTYTDYYKPSRDGTLPKHMKFIQALATDNPNISPHYIANLKTLPKNSQERLLHGNWQYDDDPARLMDIEAISDIFSNDFVVEGTGYITADIARLGNDKTVIGVWSGMRCHTIVTIDKSTLDVVADKIEALRIKWNVRKSNTLVDEDGLGAGVKDMLKCKGFINGSRPIKEKGKEPNFANLKAQCAYKLADMVNDGLIYVNCTQQERDLIMAELEVVKQKHMDKDTKLNILDKAGVKDLIGRSPDYFDMLNMKMKFTFQSSGFTSSRSASFTRS